MFTLYISTSYYSPINLQMVFHNKISSVIQTKHTLKGIYHCNVCHYCSYIRWIRNPHIITPQSPRSPFGQHNGWIDWKNLLDPFIYVYYRFSPIWWLVVFYYCLYIVKSSFQTATSVCLYVFLVPYFIQDKKWWILLKTLCGKGGKLQ